MFRSMLIAALLAGSLAGLLLSGVQHLQVIPMIMQAEQLEAIHLQNHPATPPDNHATDSGLQRTALTILSNVLTGIGFALLIAGSIILSNRVGWRKGLLWGLAGYLVFFIAPSLELPPELPGMKGMSHTLTDRQTWWLLTVACAAAGLAMLALARSHLIRGAGLIVLLAPHLAVALSGSVPPALLLLSSGASGNPALDFLLATALANGLFWLTLGGLSGHLLRHTRPAGA